MTKIHLTSLGPLMISIEGQHLSDAEKTRLKHPLIGGIILFSRNFENCSQLHQLVLSIQALRSPQLLIAVDHEGGRVQRFRDGFTHIPAMGKLGKYFESSPEEAKILTEECGWLMAIELLSLGIDFSFAPVLDINYGNNEVIADRAFHRDIKTIKQLSSQFRQGMQRAGMISVGKHFPGHGFVTTDSHQELPSDQRLLEQLATSDLLPFRHAINEGIEAIMPAHVIYPAIDSNPAGFSSFWLQEMLRQQLQFEGVIISDDLNMGGAKWAGNVVDRAQVALSAGCNLLLHCNNPDGDQQLIEQLSTTNIDNKYNLLEKLYGQPCSDTQSAEQARIADKINQFNCQS